VFAEFAFYLFVATFPKPKLSPTKKKNMQSLETGVIVMDSHRFSLMQNPITNSKKAFIQNFMNLLRIL